MKKLIYSILIVTVLFLGIQGVKAEEEKLTCVYGDVTFVATQSTVSNNYAKKGNAIFKEIGASNFKQTKSSQLVLSCPNEVYIRTVPHLEDPSMPIYISFDKKALGGSVYNSVELDTTKSTNDIVLGNTDSGSFKECVYQSYGTNTMEVLITYKNGAITVNSGSFPFLSDLKPSDFENNGALICPDYSVNCTTVEYSGLKQCSAVMADDKHPSSLKSEILTGNQIAYGNYLAYLGDLKVALKLSPNYNSIKNVPIDLGNGKTTTLNVIEESYGLCATNDCGGPEYVEHAIEAGTRNVANYCNEIYKSYSQNKTQNEKAMKECMGFGKFYNELTENGLVSSNLSANCPLLSNDMIVKLKWVLNIFRIVAPIIAIALGTVDFIKVIASGDADKEMKNAGKRLLYRLIAAVLLLIIPTIIAFLMDVFLGNSDGYDSDNPFCSIVEWKE